MATDPGWPDGYAAPGHGRHSHRHVHDHQSPAGSARARRLMLFTLIPAIAVTLLGLILLWPGAVPRDSHDAQRRGYGTVVKIVEVPCDATSPTGSGRCGTVDVNLTEGPKTGHTVQLPVPSGPGAPTLHTGDRVVLSYAPGTDEIDAIIDHQRGLSLLLLVALAAAAIMAFGRLRGITALAGLALSFVVLLVFIIPGILSGHSPLLVAIVGSATIMFAVLYLTHGVNLETSVAILGTLGALTVTGLLGAAFIPFTKLTGIGSEENAYLSVTYGNVDMRGLLLAGVIIGSLGVLDDVTVTQAATVNELARTAVSRRELYRSATRIGRAHVGSAVNTIVLAYAGASLPLLLLITVSDRSAGDLLTSEFLAQEILRSAVGTIGLVASVPITTALAVLISDVVSESRRRRQRTKAPDQRRPDAPIWREPPRHHQGDSEADSSHTSYRGPSG